MALIPSLLLIIIWPGEKGRTCAQTSDGEVREIVKKDFAARMLKWKETADFLGTTAPDISWGKVTRYDQIEPQNSLSVPFTARGNKASKDYVGIYVCEKGYVEYSVR